jgi:chorismate synthase
MKTEQDTASILGGVMAGLTTGAPLSVLIENKDFVNWRDNTIPPIAIPRPGHADLTGALKYGYTDLRPSLERASARETAVRVAVGAVCKHLLRQFEILIGGYVESIGEIVANLDQIPLPDRLILAEASPVRCPSKEASRVMEGQIEKVVKAGDTLGGVIELLAFGLPTGLGSYAQWDRRLDARLGAALLSVPAIKGVEIGPAFVNTRLPGTKAHDEIHLDGDQITRSSNRSGGLEGGVTNGQPLILRAAMKPIASTLTPQRTVDLATGKETQTQYERSDFCPVPRAVPVLEAMVAFVLADALLEKLGGDSLAEMLPRYAGLRRAQLSDIPIDGEAQIYWPSVSLEDHS